MLDRATRIRRFPGRASELRDEASQVDAAGQVTTPPSLPASYWLLLAFLLLLFANTPFVFPALEVIHPAKLVAGATLLALLFEILGGKRKAVFPWPEGGWLIAFLAASALGCLTALWPGYAVEALSDLVKMILVFFVLALSVNSERAFRGVLWVLVLGGIFPALGTLRNYLQGNMFEGRASWVGIFSNPNEVAYCLVVLLPFAAYLASVSGWLARSVLLVISLCYLGAIFVTFSRGGIIGIVAITALYAWRKRSVLLRVSLAVILIGGFLGAGKYWARNEGFSQLDNDVSLQQRMLTYEAGLKMFTDHPILGVGLKCSVVAWPLYAPPGVYAKKALVTHNTLVQAFGETGLLGGLCFWLLTGSAIYRARKLALYGSSTNRGIAIEVALWGFVICGMSGGYVMTWFPYILFGVGVAAGRISAIEYVPAKTPAKRRQRIRTTWNNERGYTTPGGSNAIAIQPAV